MTQATMDPQIAQGLAKLYDGESLDQGLTEAMFSEVVKGNVDDIVLSSMLTALKIKGESPAEIAGAASALINNATAFPSPTGTFADIVGTGGDGHNTINVSSASAIVAASCGLTVAKHGNRSVSSRSGSADLFASFGLELSMSPDVARRCLDETNLCFLFAPVYHAGIKHAMNVRTTLKTRTLFNLLGPLANPARPSHIMIGVYHPDLLMPFAETLQRLGYQKALVVHGDGLDELALHGPSQAIEVNGDTLNRTTLMPQEFGLREYPLDAIKGGEPDENRALIADILQGKGQDAHEAAVAMNAGALLKLAGLADSYKEGADMAIASMRSGTALATIENAARCSQGA